MAHSDVLGGLALLALAGWPVVKAVMGAPQVRLPATGMALAAVSFIAGLVSWVFSRTGMPPSGWRAWALLIGFIGGIPLGLLVHSQLKGYALSRGRTVVTVFGTRRHGSTPSRRVIRSKRPQPLEGHRDTSVSAGMAMMKALATAKRIQPGAAAVQKGGTLEDAMAHARKEEALATYWPNCNHAALQLHYPDLKDVIGHMGSCAKGPCRFRSWTCGSTCCPYIPGWKKPLHLCCTPRAA